MATYKEQKTAKKIKFQITGREEFMIIAHRYDPVTTERQPDAVTHTNLMQMEYDLAGANKELEALQQRVDDMKEMFEDAKSAIADAFPGSTGNRPNN